MLNYSHLSDEELLNGASIDGMKMSEILKRYVNFVFLLAHSYSKKADFDELVSDGMSGLVEAVNEYDPTKGDFTAFAGVCVRNRMRNVVKRSSLRNAGISDNSEEELASIADPAPSPEDVVIAREDRISNMERIRAELSELELHCLEYSVFGFSYEEIAQRLGCDRKSVDNALCRARKKLKRIYLG